MGDPTRSTTEAAPAASVADGSIEGKGAPQPGTGLCLSGGGYRAMLFHLGVLWRLNEFGMLVRLSRVSSVSGGSITAALLGLKWSRLVWQPDGTALGFSKEIVDPIRRLASQTIDVKSVVGGALTPWVSISDKVERAYRKYLYGNATLQDLPLETSGVPRFVINATNVQTGALWRFSRPYMADYRVGRVNNPKIALAFAVTASSAFPPFLSPARMKLADGEVLPLDGADLHRKPYTTNVVLSDGGVYDNLGVETLKQYATVLVSDGGGQMEAEPDPHSNWAHHALRINGLIDNQVRALRKREIVGSLVSGVRKGAYWRTRGHIADYPAPNKLPCPPDRTLALAQISTRLARLASIDQERLINWGYALSDAAIRSHVDKALPAPTDFPYPSVAV